LAAVGEVTGLNQVWLSASAYMRWGPSVKYPLALKQAPSWEAGAGARAAAPKTEASRESLAPVQQALRRPCKRCDLALLVEEPSQARP
jgi:hypothetical protein